MAQYKVDNVPRPGEWPGVIESYKIVKPHVKPRIWDFIAAVGVGIIISLIVEIILGAIFKHDIGGTVIIDLISIAIGAFIQASLIFMYFSVLSKQDFALNDALVFGYKRLLKMTGLLIEMYVLLIVSFILLIVPFFIVLPRLYLAPYYLILNDCTVSEALAASWHSTKGNSSKVYGIIGLDIAIAILFFTIIGIPFAIYFGIINTGSFALLTLYLSQPKKNAKKAAKLTA